GGFKVFQWTDSSSVNQSDCRLDEFEEINIFPNPVLRGSKVYISAENADIYDISGRVIDKIKQNKHHINTANYPPGIYLVVPKNSKATGKILILE
ncbi:T9SS type A sorting domain-containing protein, partial [bacterium]|nr:T9SS type A sorting domain-containing protein [bacterium]